jgi:hypothetical protein
MYGCRGCDWALRLDPASQPAASAGSLALGLADLCRQHGSKHVVQLVGHPMRGRASTPGIRAITKSCSYLIQVVLSSLGSIMVQPLGQEVKTLVWSV